MADFQEQVMGMTGLTIDGSSTAPSRPEFSTFLNDGVIDVTNKSIALDPNSKHNFSRLSSEQTSNGFNPGTNNIISVIRESGTANDWRPCRKSSMDLQSRVVDTNSLHYASKFNPVYMISQNRNVHVFPEPDSSGVNGFKVLYVNSSPEETDGSALDHASTGIKWFPEDRVYLVIIYAAIKSLESALSAAGSIPTVQGDSDELTDVTSGTIGSAETDFDQWYHILGQFIEDEEDQELASMQIQKINSYIQAFQAQNQANVSNHAFLQLRHAVLSKQYEQAFIQGKELKK